jgi:hypothetical protein
MTEHPYSFVHTSMSVSTATADPPPPTIAGHAFAVGTRAPTMLSLDIALGGEPLDALARALAKLEGVRVAGGPDGADGTRSYLVHGLGFKMVLSSPRGTDDGARALVTRVPQVSLGILSILDVVFDRLMSAPAPIHAEDAAARPDGADGEDERSAARRTSSLLRRSTLQPGKPLARKTALTRKTPLARGRFERP